MEQAEPTPRDSQKVFLLLRDMHYLCKSKAERQHRGKLHNSTLGPESLYPIPFPSRRAAPTHQEVPP